VMMVLDRFPIGDLAVTLLLLNMLSAGLQRALSRRRRVDGKQRELFFEVCSVAGRTRRLVRSTYQRLKSVPTTSAGVFVKRHTRAYSFARRQAMASVSRTLRGTINFSRLVRRQPRSPPAGTTTLTARATGSRRRSGRIHSLRKKHSDNRRTDRMSVPRWWARECRPSPTR